MLLTAVDANAATAIDGKLVQISRICRCGCTVATGQCGSSPTGGFALHSCCAFSKQVPCMILWYLMSYHDHIWIINRLHHLDFITLQCVNWFHGGVRCGWTSRLVPVLWGSFTVQLSQCCFLADGTFDTLLQSFHAFYVTFNASPFGDCVDFWGVLKASFSSPSSDLFSVFCQFLHILAWMVFFSLSISATDPWSSTVMASTLLLLQTGPAWTDLSLNSVSCRRLHMRRSNPRDRDGDHKISPYRCCFLCWVRSTFEICGVALPTAAADSCWRHWKTPLCSCTQYDQVWTSC